MVLTSLVQTRRMGNDETIKKLINVIKLLIILNLFSTLLCYRSRHLE